MTSSFRTHKIELNGMESVIPFISRLVVSFTGDGQLGNETWKRNLEKFLSHNYQLGSINIHFEKLQRTWKRVNYVKRF